MTGSERRLEDHFTQAGEKRQVLCISSCCRTGLGSTDSISLLAEHRCTDSSCQDLPRQALSWHPGKGDPEFSSWDVTNIGWDFALLAKLGHSNSCCTLGSWTLLPPEPVWSFLSSDENSLHLNGCSLPLKYIGKTQCLIHSSSPGTNSINKQHLLSNAFHIAMCIYPLSC